MEHRSRIYDLEELLLKKYEIELKNPKLLELAMTHSSFANESGNDVKSNERLEFLGDGILKAALRDWLYKNYSTWNEGKLSRIIKEYESNDDLKEPSKLLGIQKSIILGNTYKGEVDEDASYITDAVEALIGAIYLDKGFSETQKFIEKVILLNFDPEKDTDYTSAVYIYAKQSNIEVDVQLVYECSGTHENTFTFKVSVGEYICFGTGNSKPTARKLAFKEIYSILDIKSKIATPKANVNYKGLINDHFYGLYNKKVHEYLCRNSKEGTFECKLLVQGEYISTGYGLSEKLAKIDAAKKSCEILEILE